MKEANSHEAPFKESLEETGFREYIKRLKDSPDKLVRERELIFDMPKEMKIAQKGKAVFYGLRDNYNIAVPGIDYVIGKEKGYLKLFTVTDRIYGENLSKIEKLPPEAKDKFEHFFTAMSRYYFDTYRNGGDYWWDFHEEQLSYGHKKDEKENRIYIVDIDPATWEQQAGKSGKIFQMFERVISAMKSAEEKFEQPTSLERSRNELGKILEELVKDHPQNQKLENLKKIISEGHFGLQNG